MAKRKVKAPIGYHFMIKSDNDFYIMKTTRSYSKHSANGYTSSLTLDVEVKGSHDSSTTTQRTATATSSTGRTTTTRTVRQASPRTTSSGSSGSSSSGGGY